jgi:hypothetical protein
MTEVLVREQVVAQRDRFTSFRLLEQIVEALERLSPRQAGVIPTEGPVAEVVPVIVPDVERAQMPLFLMDSDPMDLPFSLEVDKDSEEDSGCSSENEGSRGRNKNTGSGNKNTGSGNKNAGSRSEDSDDRDAMVE